VKEFRELPNCVLVDV